MKRVDRLIIKAKKKCGYEQLAVAFIYQSEDEPGKWIARGDIWNGKKGSGALLFSASERIFPCGDALILPYNRFYNADNFRIGAAWVTCACCSSIKL